MLRVSVTLGPELLPTLIINLSPLSFSQFQMQKQVILTGCSEGTSTWKSFSFH